MAELKLDAVSLAFGGLKVLEGVSFQAQDGELFALIGPNGAGKTSVLNCICGLYRAGGGRIEFAGRAITGEKPHRIARMGVARTFQHGEPFAHMTVVEKLVVAPDARVAPGL